MKYSLTLVYEVEANSEAEAAEKVIRYNLGDTYHYEQKMLEHVGKAEVCFVDADIQPKD
jgi:hypothetical protein